METDYAQEFEKLSIEAETAAERCALLGFLDQAFVNRKLSDQLKRDAEEVRMTTREDLTARRKQLQEELEHLRTEVHRVENELFEVDWELKHHRLPSGDQANVEN